MRPCRSRVAETSSRQDVSSLTSARRWVTSRSPASQAGSATSAATTDAPSDARCRLRAAPMPEAPGIVHSIADVLVQEKCAIVESHQFDSLTSGMFYMRVEFAHVDGSPLDLPRLRAAFEETTRRFGMSWRLADAAERQRVLIM